MIKEQILDKLNDMLTADQINTDADDLYDASADRYKKYAKAKRYWITQFLQQLFIQKYR